MGIYPTHAKAIRNLLVEAMRSGLYAGCPHLPPEQELAQSLNISRTQLRDALACLEQEGFITRRHGVGTLINHHVVNIRNRMDIETEFLDMIKQSGFQPGLAYVRVQEETAGPDLAETLQLAPEAPVLRVSRLCTADGRPAIYCEDLVPLSLLKVPYDPQRLQISIFQFLQEYCGISVYMDRTDLRPVTADDTLAERFRVPVGSPLLCMRETDYDLNGKPVFFSLQYFADGIFQHTVIRKKL